ncbi:MAG: phosphate ABC transporter substrate-binding protein [Methanothrix sp.]|uniref:Phosphate binding protein n=1 Tax=Methanothrix harundinacea TaxID=301375 RepID=A0A101FUV1_9EURY|nr:MAG: phosphate-binding protein [Methanosaeta sp. SDB]KUK44841.1 MAG: Phosphate binding protein [Methanothrix harundinacea]MDD2637514.1 phosphate ABC transporter substrate-binding protein [Methanothrix sp.]MDI9398852.1 phosphate ABC transporter substrate-binding protein [Euryarchaeota archaeon]KUK96276.1 MAG: Phosphate binding protein [Methanothrix harundinacea]
MNRPSTSFLTAILVIASILSFSGCIDEERETEPATEAAAITVAGSTTVMPLVEASAEEFNQIQNGVRASVTGGGSGVGIKNVAQGLAEIAMASRQVKPDEIATYGDSFEEFLVAYDAIAVVVSQPIYEAGVTDLSQDEVAAIYSGEVANWMDVGGPDERIYVVAREVGSGTRDTFNEMVMGSIEAETPGVTTYHGSNAEVKTAVTNSDKAIGYVGMNYVEGGALRAVDYDGAMPFAETIKDGTYPLSRALNLYTFGDPSPGAKEFIEFVLSDEGQIIVAESGFVPVR